MDQFKLVVRFTLLAAMIMALAGACSKEEEKVTPYPYTPPNYDSGHLIIKMHEVNFGIDPKTNISSIDITNQTSGITNQLSPSLMAYDNVNGRGILSYPLSGGYTGDQMSCCVNFNSTITVTIGLAFEDILLDSVPMGTITGNSYCIAGTY